MYNIVPNILSGKDLDYLSDMFEWNYNAYKNINNNIDKIKDVEIKNILQEGSELFKNNMNQVLEILRCNYE